MSKHRASPFGMAPSNPDPNHQPKHRNEEHLHWWLQVGREQRWKCVRLGCGVLTDKAPKRAWSA